MIYLSIKNIIMKKRLSIMFLIFILFLNHSFAQTSSLVSLGVSGKLEYRTYSNIGQSNSVNVIPDFSFAGYNGGGVVLPMVPVTETVQPMSGNAKAAIQAAIDKVSSFPLNTNGFRGAVLLKSGRYEVNGSLYIKASGVVLRGEGQNTPDKEGTEIIASSPTQHDFIQFRGNEITTSDPAGAKRISSPYVPTGAISFDLENITGLSVGDLITVTRTPNDAWINALDMAQFGWVASSYRISYERVITGISGNTITINIPIVQVMETGFGGGEIVKISISGRIRNCGIENMLISSIYSSDTDENHGWSAVTFSQTADCWARKVTARYFGYSCVGLYDAFSTTVEECAMLDPKSIIDGSRRYSFYIDKGSFNLFQRCYTRGGRHDYVTGSRVAGPNVFVDCYATKTYADIGPHHRYATGILFDNIQGGETRVQNRKAMGTGHGWAGAQTMFWNCISNTGELKVESPFGAMNWGIGCIGVLKLGAGFWESYGSPVTPRSLYYQQLKDRLGNSAVDNITLPVQRTGNIWSYLSTWAGIGDLSVITKSSFDEENIPSNFSLSQNYPNPFNPVTTIQFSVPSNGHATLKIFTISGQEVATLYNKEAESKIFHQVQFNAVDLGTGTYYSRLEFEGNVAMKKLLLLK
jgi:hypothetical protein